MINKAIVVFHDNNDQDVTLGLSMIWEVYKSNGYTHWLNGDDVFNNGFIGVEPCDVVLINYTLPLAILNTLRFQGFNIIYIGNKFSPTVTFADTVSFDITIIDAESPISAILHAYYIYLQHSRIGNRINFLPSKLVSDSLNFIYNNKLVELTSVNLVTGNFIAGLNGPILKQNIGGPVTISRSAERMMHDWLKDKGVVYV